MVHLKRFFILCMSIVMCIVVTGCTQSFTSVDTLITPPRLTKEQDRIYTALKKSLKDIVQDQFSLVYPKSGEYKSAFILKNIDQEETDEVLAFFKESDTSPVKIYVLDREHGEWSVKAKQTTQNEGSPVFTEVEQVSFIQEKNGDDERVYIVVGLNTASSTEKTIRVYEYSGTKLNEIKPYSIKCSNYAVYDINVDGRKEIITLNDGSSDAQAKPEAKMYSVLNGEFELNGVVAMDTDVVSYVNIFNGYLNNRTPAIYVDTQKRDDVYGTEILAFVDGRLSNVIVQDKLQPQTTRLQGLSSTDYGNSGIYRIPKEIPLPGYPQIITSDSSYSYPYFLRWNQYNFDTHELEGKTITYSNDKLGYRLMIPERWLGAVTAKLDPNSNEITFYVFEDDISNQAKTLLKIKVLTLKEQEELYGYQKIAERGQLVYTYALKVTGSEYDLTHDEFEKMFRTMS